MSHKEGERNILSEEKNKPTEQTGHDGQIQDDRRGLDAGDLLDERQNSNSGDPMDHSNKPGDQATSKLSASDIGGTSWLIGNVVVHKNDIKATERGERFNDIVIDAYLAKLAAKSKHRVTVFSTFTLNVIKNWNMSRSLTSFIATYEPSNILLIPFNVEGNHWAIFVVNRTKKENRSA